jgi:hypothetical protein
LISGWWFGTWFFDFPYIGNFIIPTDELIFFRGVGQPSTSQKIGPINVPTGKPTTVRVGNVPLVRMISRNRGRSITSLKCP